MTPSLNLSNLSKQIKKVIEDLNIQVISRWAPSCTNILLLPTSRKSEKQDYWCWRFAFPCLFGGTGSIFINILVQLAMLPPMHWRNSVSCTNIYVETYAQKLKKYQATCCHITSAAPIMGHGVMFTLFGVYSFGTFFHSHNNF